MPRVASCPQCEHELLVPEGANADAWATCPKCQAFFELKGVKARELPALLLVDSDAGSLDAGHSDPPSTPTVPDFSPIAAWSSDSHTDAKTTTTDAVTDQLPLDVAASQLSDESLAAEPYEHESPEIAAQRIDAWFRSAKTLSDVPQGALAAAEQSEERAAEAPAPDVSGATADAGVVDADTAGQNSEIELETPAELPPETAAWDDSQHMDRLLAELENQPVDSFEQGGHDDVASPDEQPFQPAEEWSADVPLSVPISADTTRPKRSMVRTMLFSVFGGLIGLGLGYYALLWLGALLHSGREIDFLDVAKYLPRAVLPASFRVDEKQSMPAAGPTNMISDLAASAKTTEPVPATVSTPPEKQLAPEKQAAFTEPAELPKAKSNEPSDDRYAIPATTNAPPHEPAKLEAPTAKAMPEPPPAENVHIANAPSFTPAELTAGLQAANEELPALVTGNLSDGGSAAHAKGKSYMAIADMAQKATFTAPSTSPEVKKLQRQADEFFRSVLSNVHTRDEVAQIVPLWLSHANRPQNGVFFAGNVTRHQDKGTVVECSVELSGGRSMTVLVPTAVSRDLNGSSGPVAIAGWIVEKPREQVEGYTGSAPQAVFTNRLIPLE